MKISEILLENYSAYVLTKKSRRELLSKFPPKFSLIRGDHITIKFGIGKNTPKPTPAKIKIIGYASDDSLEAVVVSVNGKTQRSDGSIYHITLSYEPNRKPMQSNALVKNGWKSIKPFDIDGVGEILK